MAASTLIQRDAGAAPAAIVRTYRLSEELTGHALAATRAAALAAAGWAGRGDAHGADAAATTAMRTALARAPGSGRVVTGEGAKDEAPMLADGEEFGDGRGARYDIAVDPLECTDFCAQGLPGALATIAIARRGALWSPGPGFYMDKLVLPPAARGATRLNDTTEVKLERVAAALGKRISDLRVVVLDKPRHRELVARLRAAGATVVTPLAGDVSGALAVVLPGGRADMLLGVGGTPEGVLTACAVRALGGGMEGRLAPQRDDERRALAAFRVDVDRLLALDELVRADATFVATGVTGGLLAAPEERDGWVVTESIVIAPGAVQRVRRATPIQE